MKSCAWVRSGLHERFLVLPRTCSKMKRGAFPFLPGKGVIEARLKRECISASLASEKCYVLPKNESKPGVNASGIFLGNPIFCHVQAKTATDREEAWRDGLLPYYRELGIDPEIPVP